MIKKYLLFSFILYNGLLFAQPLDEQALKASGHALANYQACAEVAERIGDNVMHSYYAEMFTDISTQVDGYSKKQSVIIFQEFKLSLDKLHKLNQQSLAIFCQSRFDPLTRKMQENKMPPVINNGI